MVAAVTAGLWIWRSALLGEGIDGLDGRALASRLADVERAIRRLEGVAVKIVASADRRELFRDDGHVSVRGWVKASLRLSDVEVTQRVRCARLVNRSPLWQQAMGSGRLGVAQFRELGRVGANRRCGDQLDDGGRGDDHRRHDGLLRGFLSGHPRVGTSRRRRRRPP